jgi:hypothetical protein
MKHYGYASFIGFIATVYAANLAIVHIGLVPVGFGLMAPAGVYAAGLAFTLRDVLHETLGRAWVFAAIAIGAVLSAVLSPQLAVASATAFAVSELADYAVYAPLRRRGWFRAVVASNIVGLTLDSVVFLWLAFGSLEFLAGQVVGKFWMTVLAVIIVAAYRSLRGRCAGRRSRA